ncbi:PLP-dependent aminotransferase family protein [Paenibacillus sp. RRE4]|uniref:MocR-like pyridoxine biosynthesis transcription factor PdxR n=1 Tax=Paenibacillus sp. RRE4 TaxID=2962587 RepID=UPI002881E59F|nr:PLP-dependent aminotransferase family protein [Paenibacillus sp. RRE4]MDT0124046.1 PLP-dependent aminotransferase family protein [Paenibacillus sp. RRE4]
MHIELKRGSSTKLYMQIALTIADRIRSGLIEPGTRLPSVRKMTADLGVSLVTVTKAYAELEAIQLVRCSQGKGCYVRGIEPSGQTSREAITHNQMSISDAGGSLNWQMTLVDYLPRAQLWRHFDASPQVRYELHMSAIQPELLPTRDIIDSAYHLSSDHAKRMAAYGSFQGDWELRQTFAAHFASRGLQVAPERMLITSGAQQGIDLVARTFIGPGDVVYMEAPTYTGAIDVFTSRGAKIITVPMDNEGMRIDLLTRLCDKYPPKLIYTIPTYHNPTGVTMSTKRRAQLLNIAQSYHCLILEDDPFADLYFREPPPASIKSMDSAGHVVYIKSFSKVLSPGCRVACAIADGSVLTRLVAAKSTADLGSPLLTQKALQAYIKEQYDSYVYQLREELYSRLCAASEVLEQYATKEMQWRLPEGGLNLWLELQGIMDMHELHRQSLAAGVSFLPGSACYVAESDTTSLRICFTVTSSEALKKGLQILCAVIERVSSKHAGATADRLPLI